MRPLLTPGLVVEIRNHAREIVNVEISKVHDDDSFTATNHKVYKNSQIQRAFAPEYTLENVVLLGNTKYDGLGTDALLMERHLQADRDLISSFTLSKADLPAFYQAVNEVNDGGCEILIERVVQNSHSALSFQIFIRVSQMSNLFYLGSFYRGVQQRNK